MEKIVLSPPDISEEEIAEVVDTLKSGWITTGPKTKQFEKNIADFCHTNKAICFNSATACMELVLRLLGVKEGDEVITTAYTYTATCSVILHVGATPVLVDTAKDSYHIDYDKIADAITEKTKVIIPVDVAGIMCDYDKIFEIVKAKKDMFRPETRLQRKFGRIVVLADAAHSFGSTRGVKVSGELADFTSFSFHAVKNLTTAEGGALVWKSHSGIDDDEIYKELSIMSLHGQSKDALAKCQTGSWEYDVIEPYYKFNMTDIMASIGIAQLRRYSSLIVRRKTIMKKYYSGLNTDKVDLIQHYTKDSESNTHLCLVRIKGADRKQCDRFMEEMAKKGVPLNIHYKPLPMLTAYKKRGYDIKDYPNAYEVYNNTMTIPLHTKLTDEQVDYIITTFNETLEELGL